MTNCEELLQACLSYLGQEFTCALEGPYWAISTPFLYPDGDAIEIFVESLPDGNFRLSDLGESLRKLANVDFSLKGKMRQRAFARIINSTGVFGGQSEIYTIASKEDIGPKMLDLVDALKQTASLIYMKRRRFMPTFREEVGVFLRETGLEPQPEYALVGASGIVWRLHFYVDTELNHGVRTLSAGSRETAKDQLFATYTAFDDLGRRHSGLTRSAVFDDSRYQWQEDELTLLRQVTEFQAIWSQRDAYGDFLLHLGRRR